MEWQREITELHQFFEAWFRGERPGTDETFRRFEGVLAPRFRMVTPDGAVLERAPLLAGLRSAHGTRPSIRIGVEGHEMLAELGGPVLVSYREWQEDSGPRTVRISTALLEPRAEAPLGIAWRYVHETWSRASRPAR